MHDGVEISDADRCYFQSEGDPILRIEPVEVPVRVLWLRIRVRDRRRYPCGWVWILRPFQVFLPDEVLTVSELRDLRPNWQTMRVGAELGGCRLSALPDLHSSSHLRFLPWGYCAHEVLSRLAVRGPFRISAIIPHTGPSFLRPMEKAKSAGLRAFRAPPQSCATTELTLGFRLACGNYEHVNHGESKLGSRKLYFWRKLSLARKTGVGCSISFKIVSVSVSKQCEIWSLKTIVERYFSSYKVK